MSKTAVRGTKRWCQDEACALPFYDLNRADFSCPNCGAAYDMLLTHFPGVPSQPSPTRLGRPNPAVTRKPEPEPEPEDEPASTSEEEVATGDDGAAETLIEDDDEGSDVAVPMKGGGISD